MAKDTFDIGEINYEDSAFMHLEHPRTGEPIFNEGKPSGLVLYSLYSDQVKNVQRKQQDKRLIKSMRGGRNAPKSEQLEQDAEEILVASVKEIQNIVFEGKLLETTPANIRKLLKVQWIKNQVDMYLNDEVNFMKQ